LFIYFNVPSYIYQDRIISAVVFGWAIFFLSVAKNPTKQLVQTILLIGAVTVGMLTFINLSTDFTLIANGINSTLFHLQTGVMFLYWIWILIGYRKAENLI